MPHSSVGMNTTTTSTATQADTTAPSVLTARQREPPLFSGIGDADVDDWIDAYDRASRYNHWSDVTKLTTAVFYLSDVAKLWYLNHEQEFDSWATFATRLKEVFGRPTMRQIVAERKLSSRAQQPTETFTSYIEDVLDLCRRVDINMTEPEKVRHLLKGIAEDVFQVILVSNPTTVSKIVEICQQFQELKTQRLASAATVQRLPEVSSISGPSTYININSLRQLIQQIVREEVSQALQLTQPSTTPTQSALRSLVQNEIASTVPISSPLTAPAQPMLPTYAEIAASPPMLRPHYPAVTMPYVQPFGYTQPHQQATRPQLYNRPTCYYCGIPGHVMRVCRRRQAEESANVHTSITANPTHYNQTPGYTRSNSPTTRFAGSSPGFSRRQSPSPQRHRSTSPMVPSGSTAPSQGGNF